MPIHWIGFGYAALVASGGIIGYAKAGTVCSYLTSYDFHIVAGKESPQGPQSAVFFESSLPSAP